jgi:hypothetical protein
MDAKWVQRFRQLGLRQFAWWPIIVEPSPFTPPTFVQSDQLLHQGRASNAIDLTRLENGPDVG